MTHRLHTFFFCTLILLSALVLSVSSCKKKSIPKGVVTVVNHEGVAQSNVLVKMNCPAPSCVISMEGYTDENGKVEFTNDLNAVFEASASKEESIKWNDPNQNCDKVTVDVTYFGEEFISLEEGQVAELTLIIYPNWIEPTDNPC